MCTEQPVVMLSECNYSTDLDVWHHEVTSYSYPFQCQIESVKLERLFSLTSIQAPLLTLKMSKTNNVFLIIFRYVLLCQLSKAIFSFLTVNLCYEVYKF